MKKPFQVKYKFQNRTWLVLASYATRAEAESNLPRLTSLLAAN